MNAFRSIRNRLGLTQVEMAGGIGVSQGNVSLYESGQTVPPKVAERLIEFAKTLGNVVTYDEVYAADTPDAAEPEPEPAPPTPKPRAKPAAEPAALAAEHPSGCKSYLYGVPVKLKARRPSKSERPTRGKGEC